jgi:NAD(P)-dependent dehydrogenase (short-subunit alcohol dehydrogenase family)
LPGIIQTDLVENLFRTIPLASKEKIIAKHPLGIGKPEDIANMVCFLLDSKSKWITGSEFVIDGGYALI